MSKMKTIATLALISTVAYGGYRWHSHGAASPADRELTTIDRIWVDHMPQSETDKFNLFVALSEETAGDDIGIFQNSSQWAGEHELFRHATKKNKLVVTYPQTGESDELTTKATRCSDQRGMDFCLEVSGGSRGVKRYYSRKGWEIEGRGHTEAQIEQQVHDLTLQK